MSTIYERQGYLSREDYLQHLAEDYNADIDTVLAIADFLGEEEDFDGLIIIIAAEEARSP
jgi:hypothetical protein